jgi:hypothetical protein
MLTITGQVENFSRHQWLSKGCEAKLSAELTTTLSVQDPDNQALAQSLVD